MPKRKNGCNFERYPDGYIVTWPFAIVKSSLTMGLEINDKKQLLKLKSSGWRWGG